MMNAEEVARAVTAKFNTKQVAYCASRIVFLTENSLDEMIKFVQDLDSSIDIRIAKNGKAVKITELTR